MPTYKSIFEWDEYISERIESLIGQGHTLPDNWTFEVLVVLNGKEQQKPWGQLLALKTDIFGPRLSVAYIAKEENPEMLQAKTTPLNIALAYAKDNGFDAFCAVDDDVVLSNTNLCSCLNNLRILTEERHQPVITGAKLQTFEPGTFWDHIFSKAERGHFMVRGANLCGWTKALPFIPADAFGEDLLLSLLFGKNAVEIPDEEVYFTARLASSFWKYLIQDIRLKWCDSLAVQYLPEREQRSFWFLARRAMRLIIPRQYSGLNALLCNMIVRSVNLYAFLHVRSSIFARNIFNLPKKQINWVGTVDLATKRIFHSHKIA